MDREEDGSEVFDRLVKELDPIERKALLDKLTPDSDVQPEPMQTVEEDEEIDLEKEYYSLGLFTRLVIFLKVLFSGEDKLQLTEEKVLRRIDREVRRSTGNIYSYDKGQFNEGFLEEIEKLREAVRFFRPVLNAATGASRDEFLNFLGGLQIPVIHHQLIMDTDFEAAEKRTGMKEPSDVRKEVMMNVEINLEKITGELRQSMYMHSKTIYVMNELLRFEFGDFENLFSIADSQNARSCYFGDIRGRLERLTELLSSFKYSPDKQLLEALFLFQNSTLKVRDEESISDDLKKFLESSVKHIKKIIQFNNKMQLPRLMKLITGNIDYKPKPVSGGEDWFTLYSRYWNNLAEAKYKKYSAEKRKEKIFRDMQMYFKKDDMPVLENYNFSFKYSCGFLSLFLREQFTASMNEVLKKILVDGKFYKKQNKDDFTDSYSALLGLYEKLKVFDQKCSPKGEYGMKIDNIEKEMETESQRIKKKAAIVEMADVEAFGIVRIGLEGMQLMKNVLYGILHGKAGGQYDSLSNLNKLITIESRDFIIDLNSVYSNIDDANRILGEILLLEENG